LVLIVLKNGVFSCTVANFLNFWDNLFFAVVSKISFFGSDANKKKMCSNICNYIVTSIVYDIN